MLATLRALRLRARDERGAAMVLGLFLALAAIAALWCVIGIGDAVIGRDRSQEAADSVAYASAVLHARGMNFISLINIVLLVMSMLYVLLSVIDVLLSFVLVITGVNHPSLNWCGARYWTWLAGAPINWCQIAAAVERIEVPLYNADRRYFEKYKAMATQLFNVQSWAASAVPYLALAAGAEAGAEYDHIGLAYSHSLVPGGGAPRKLNVVRPLLNTAPILVRQDGDKKINAIQDRRIGLPVDSEAAYNLCIRGTRFVLEWVYTLPGQLNFGGMTWKEWSSTQPLSTASALLFQLTGEVTRLFFCRDKEPSKSNLEGPIESIKRAGDATFLYLLAGLPDGANDKFYFKDDEFWKMPDDSFGEFADDNREYPVGPKRVVAYAYNGNDWMQTWAAVKSLDAVEKAAVNVGMPARIFGRGAEGSPPAPSGWLFSGAEFYFDCTNVWQSSYCNRGGASLYQLRWRARLRRMHWPSPGSTIFDPLIDNFVQGPFLKNFIKRKTTGRSEPVQDSHIDTIGKEIIKATTQKVFSEDTSADGYYH